MNQYNLMKCQLVKDKLTTSSKFGLQQGKIIPVLGFTQIEKPINGQIRARLFQGDNSELIR